MLQKSCVFLFVLILTACSANTVPIQPGDPYFNSSLKVKQPYVIPPTLMTLGFTFPAADYKAFMRDDNGGVYFSSPTPLMAKDEIVGTVFRTGGIYYQTAAPHNVFLYLLDTERFGGSYVSRDPMVGLKYTISK
jgi:hypothetical protein